MKARWSVQVFSDPIAAILGDHEIDDQNKVLAIRGLRRAVLYGLHIEAATTLLSMILDPLVTCPLAEFGRLVVMDV